MALPDDFRLRLDRAWEHVESLKAEIARAVRRVPSRSRLASLIGPFPACWRPYI